MPRLLPGLVAATILVISSAISWKAGAAKISTRIGGGKENDSCAVWGCIAGVDKEVIFLGRQIPLTVAIHHRPH